MENKYVSFISDEHLLNCISQLHRTYVKAWGIVDKSALYKNKVDVFKMLFDAKFSSSEYEMLLLNEIARQADKSINNAIGTFHENILGGIEGFQSGTLSGYDIKSNDNTLFADIKNKHNTMNSSSAEALFQKLANYANQFKKARCYWVQILAKSSFEELWTADINGKEYSHSRVYKISGDRFYAKLSNEPDALFNLYKALPVAIDDYLRLYCKSEVTKSNYAVAEILKEIDKERSILDQIAKDNFVYYEGFKDL